MTFKASDNYLQQKAFVEKGDSMFLDTGCSFALGEQSPGMGVLFELPRQELFCVEGGGLWQSCVCGGGGVDPSLAFNLAGG